MNALWQAREQSKWFAGLKSVIATRLRNASAWQGARSPVHRGDRSTLSAFVRWPGGGFLCLLRSDTDLFQERLDVLFPAKEILDGKVDITTIAQLLNFAATFRARLFIAVTV